MAGGERRSFLRNAASAYAQRGLLALSALLLTPYLFRGLDLAGFGTWSVMFTLTTIFTMIEVGFSAGATKHVAELNAQARRTQLEATLGAAAFLMVGLGLVVLSSCAVLGFAATGLAASGQGDEFRSGMLILGAGFLIRFFFVAYAAALQGLQRYDAFNAGQAVSIVAFAAGAVVAVEAGHGVLGVAVAYSVAQALGAVLWAPLLHRVDPGLRLRPRRADLPTARGLAPVSSFTLLADFMIFLGGRFDTVVIAAIRGATAAAPFAAALKLQNGIQAPTVPVIGLMMPMVADLEARGRLREAARRFVVAIRVTLQVTTPLVLAVALFATDIVEVWLGPTAPAVTDEIVAILALTALMIAVYPADKFLIGLGRARTVAIFNTFEGIANLALSIALVVAHGAVGAAIGSMVTSFAIGPLKLPIACRTARYPLGRLLRDGVGRALLSTLPGAAAMLCVYLLLEPGLGRLVLGLALGLGLSLLVGVLQVGPGRVRDQFRRLPWRKQAESERELSRLVGQGPS